MLHAVHIHDDDLELYNGGRLGGIISFFRFGNFRLWLFAFEGGRCLPFPLFNFRTL